MRKDEQGNPCPKTLGEYYALCATLGGVDCPACTFLKEKIDSSKNGRDEVVIADDSQMRTLLFPMLVK